jgi:hypothetical protein
MPADTPPKNPPQLKSSACAVDVNAVVAMTARKIRLLKGNSCWKYLHVMRATSIESEVS